MSKICSEGLRQTKFWIHHLAEKYQVGCKVFRLFRIVEKLKGTTLFDNFNQQCSFHYCASPSLGLKESVRFGFDHLILNAALQVYEGLKRKEQTII